MLTDEDTRAMRGRCEAATPGPWKYEAERYSAKCVIGIRPRDDRWVAHAQLEMNGEANGSFIAHARTDLPRCLDEIERLKSEISTLNYTLDRVAKLADTRFQLCAVDYEEAQDELLEFIDSRNKENGDAG